MHYLRDVARKRTRKTRDRFENHTVWNTRVEKHTRKKRDKICKEKNDICENYDFLKRYSCTRQPVSW